MFVWYRSDVAHFSPKAGLGFRIVEMMRLTLCALCALLFIV